MRTGWRSSADDLGDGLLGARPGDEIEFVARGDQVVVEVRHRRSFLDFAGVAANAAPGVPSTAAELDGLVEWGMAEAATARSTRARRPGGRPLVAIGNRLPLIPLTDATIAFNTGEGVEAVDAETLIINRSLADWVRADDDEQPAFDGVRQVAPHRAI